MYIMHGWHYTHVDRLLNKIIQIVETPGKSITHLIEIEGIDHLYLSIDTRSNNFA